MSQYRNGLPQIRDQWFITDGGLETTLIFHDGIELPYFAAFDLLRHEAGRERLRRYFGRYAQIAQQQRVGLVLEAPTWRANRDWAQRLGYDTTALAKANRDAIDLLRDIRSRYQTPDSPMVISGNLGPRGDGYRADARMSVSEARAYHREQIKTFAGTQADMVAAFTITYVEEAVGIVQAARAAQMPVVISFTLETDGLLPSGESLGAAIERSDEETDGYAAYYMVNCAHPTHFRQTLDNAGSWRKRIRGLRANASRRSHAELDESTELDAGDPHELGGEYAALMALLPELRVVGGCCGTDHRHVAAITLACLPPAAEVARR